MLTTPELPNPLREDEEVLVLQPGGRQAKPKQRRGKPEDPLLELFRPPKGRTPGKFNFFLYGGLDHPYTKTQTNQMLTFDMPWPT